VNKRYDDFRKEKKFEEDKKERYKREFNIVDPNEIYQDKKTPSSDGPGYTKLDPKPEPAKEVIADELSIPFGLEDEVAPLSDADLNEVFGSYEPLTLDEQDQPASRPQEEPDPWQFDPIDEEVKPVPSQPSQPVAPQTTEPEGQACRCAASQTTTNLELSKAFFEPVTTQRTGAIVIRRRYRSTTRNYRYDISQF
jgi:hypothetical protein